MAPSDSRPEKITGGCLCEAIRYTINITPEMEWPPSRNGTCQCTKCRKFTGSLYQTSCTFPLTAITPPLESNPSYTMYFSSEKGRRGFCRICGSSITFSVLGSLGLEILFGTVDQEFLKSKAGTELCLGSGNLWCENEVKGVTDHLPGVHWKDEYSGEKLRENPVNLKGALEKFETK